jgi:hypothetical protein
LPADFQKELLLLCWDVQMLGEQFGNLSRGTALIGFDLED